MRATTHIHTHILPNSKNPVLGTGLTCKQLMTWHVFKTGPVFETQFLFEVWLLLVQNSWTLGLYLRPSFCLRPGFYLRIYC